MVPVNGTFHIVVNSYLQILLFVTGKRMHKLGCKFNNMEIYATLVSFYFAQRIAARVCLSPVHINLPIMHVSEHEKNATFLAKEASAHVTSKNDIKVEDKLCLFVSYK